jgi:hypothetical protein
MLTEPQSSLLDLILKKFKTSQTTQIQTVEYKIWVIYKQTKCADEQ